MKKSLDAATLYGILDTGYVQKPDLESVAKALLHGGVDVLQLRAKGYDEDGVLSLLKNSLPRLSAMCKEYEVPLIINDFPNVAAAIGADGIHVGQDDGSLQQVRAIVGEDMLVGRSTHSPEQAQQAFEQGFDYIGFGPLFPTPTKQGRLGIGMDAIGVVQSTVGEHIPMFCIGGVKPDNLETVLSAGARRVVIVSALLQAPDISQATRKVKELIARGINPQ